MINKALAAAQQKRREMVEAGIKIEQKNPSEKARDNPTSLRAAINGKCFECEGSGADPGWKQRIGSCTLKDTCSLWPVRPYQP